MFALYAEGDDKLILRSGDGTEERTLTVSAATLKRFTLNDVAADLKQELVYSMRDQQGSEDTRL
jgi:hypothetical protein